MTGDTDQNSPVKVKFVRVERLVNPLTMGGRDAPYFRFYQPCSHLALPSSNGHRANENVPMHKGTFPRVIHQR